MNNFKIIVKIHGIALGLAIWPFLLADVGEGVKICLELSQYSFLAGLATMTFVSTLTAIHACELCHILHCLVQQLSGTVRA